MSKRSRFRGPFDNQHGKRVEPMFKSIWQHLYHIHPSLPSQLNWKKSLFFTCQILGLLVDTLTANENYPVLNRDNLTIPIQMQLSQKRKSFCFLLDFWKLGEILNILTKKMMLIDFVISKLRTPKRYSEKCLKSPVSEILSTSNMGNVPKHCWNLDDSTFIKFIDHCQLNCLGKSLFYWHAKSWDCLLTDWLPIKRILFLIKTI